MIKIVNIFENSLIKYSKKFVINIFFLKYNVYFLYNQINYITLFFTIYNIFNIKILNNFNSNKYIIIITLLNIFFFNYLIMLLII